jgi:hypothetical protein
MATVLHLVGPNDPGAALPIMAGQLAAGDAVTVAVVGPATPSPLPPGLTVHRVPAELSWAQLLDLIFTADQTFSW